MQIIVPAYNVKADQATRYETQIAAIMHMHRDKELNRFKNDKLPHAAAPKLPEGEKKLTGSARGRENNATDELVLRVLANREMSISEIADAVNFSRQLVRHVVDRLLSRKEIARRNTHDRVTLFYKIGEQVHVE